MKNALAVIILLFAANIVCAQSENFNSEKDTLVVLWSSADPEVAEKVCFLYTNAAVEYKWFKHVIFIIWGPSAKLLAENEGLQKRIKSMKAKGAQLEACIVCADSFGVSDQLRDMGIKVFGTGRPLTTYLKNGYSMLTF